MSKILSIASPILSFMLFFIIAYFYPYHGDWTWYIVTLYILGINAILETPFKLIIATQSKSSKKYICFIFVYDLLFLIGLYSIDFFVDMSCNIRLLFCTSFFAPEILSIIVIITNSFKQRKDLSIEDGKS